MKKLPDGCGYGYGNGYGGGYGHGHGYGSGYRAYPYIMITKTNTSKQNKL
jgi:hypothetical protein